MSKTGTYFIIGHLTAKILTVWPCYDGLSLQCAEVVIGADVEALATLCLLRSSRPSWMSVRSDAFRSLMRSLEDMVVDIALGADRDILVGLDTTGTNTGTLAPGIGTDDLTRVSCN